VNKAREQPIIIVRKKVHGHGHHGGAWKVAFADFMTAMFALFLVLWLVNQSSDVKAAVAGYFNDPLGRAHEFGSTIIPGTGAQVSTPQPPLNPTIIDLRRKRLTSLAEEIKQRLQQTPEFKGLTDKVEITLTDEGLHIQLLEDSSGVFFQTGSAVPSPAGTALFQLLGSELAKLPNAVVIEGHTDARPYASRNGYSNWELSADRANAARHIMGQGGLNDAQVQQVRGFADRRLRVPSDPLAPSNRRVTITMLLPKTDGSPGAPDDSLAEPDSVPAAPHPDAHASAAAHADSIATGPLPAPVPRP
jgi:chemotaxis protein MotB